MHNRYAAQSTAQKTPPDRLRRRALIIVSLLALWFGGIAARLIYLQVTQHERLSSIARQQQEGTASTSAPRGLILDRQGRELARSIDVPSFYADPVAIENIAQTAEKIAPVLGLDAGELTMRLTEAKEQRKRFVWLRRKADQETLERVASLKLKGIAVRSESKRVYPNNNLASHIVGFVGTDERGLGGIEQTQNRRLTGEAGRVFIGMDARRNSFESYATEAREGESLVLTIDAAVQYHTEVALNAAVEKAHARSGTAIVLDPRTGEILALANAPNFNPNRANEEAPERRTNEALQNIYEPGSTFKVVAYAGAIEEGLAKPEDLIDCLGGGINVFGRFVRDHTPYGTLTLTEALAKSSNVAAIKLGLKLGDEQMHDYMTRFGFGRRTGVDLPGETAGLLRPVARWHKSSIGSIAIGQEIGVTPLQMAAAFGALANDGIRIRPHLVREIRAADGSVTQRPQAETTRVVSSETAHALRGMLESVTLKGTAKRAQLDGYTAAGKTGTAQKIDPRTRAYSATKHVASFVGFAPVEKPEVVIVAVIDEPVGAYHGGDTAAPLFREIADRILPYLNVLPDGVLRDDPAMNQLASFNPAETNLTQPVKLAQNEDESLTANEGAPESLPPVAFMPRLRERAAQNGSEVVYAAADEAALVMPDLAGSSVRDAWNICARLGLQLEARGEGRALKQSPAPGAHVQSGQTVAIEFMRPGG